MTTIESEQELPLTIQLLETKIEILEIKIERLQADMDIHSALIEQMSKNLVTLADITT